MIYAMTDALLPHGESDILFSMVISLSRTSLIAENLFWQNRLRAVG
jgi:hypothetical protein